MSEPDDTLPPLEALQRKIDQAKGPVPSHKLSVSGDSGSNGDMALVMRFSVELLAGVFVGGMVGYALDHWLGTLPLFLIICLFLGVAGGMLNVIRSGRMIDKKADAQQTSSETDNL